MICCGKEMRHTKIGYFLCEECGNKVEDELGLIRRTLEEHPGANLIELVKYTGLPSNVLLEYLNDGTITFVEKKKEMKGYYVGSQQKARWHIDIPNRKK